jgi:hypothetical protein
MYTSCIDNPFIVVIAAQNTTEAIKLLVEDKKNKQRHCKQDVACCANFLATLLA